MRARFLAAAIAGLPCPIAAASSKPVVVELYTSEACSSCPPAEALLGELGRDPAVIPLAFHVDYWNGPSWRDPYASAAATDRQRALAARRRTDEIYTPEMVVDGGPGFVGSDRRTALNAIAVDADRAPYVAAALTGEGDRLVVRIGAGVGEGTLRLYGTDAQVRRSIGGGENEGARLTEFSVVCSMADIARWNGRPIELRLNRPAGQRFAVVLEAQDGRILAAAKLASGTP